MTSPSSSPIEDAAEVAALREALTECQQLAGRFGPTNEIEACNKIERVAKRALSLTPSAAAERVRRMGRVIEAAREVSAYHGQPVAALQKRLDALDAAVAALDNL